MDNTREHQVAEVPKANPNTVYSKKFIQEK